MDEKVAELLDRASVISNLVNENPSSVLLEKESRIDWELAHALSDQESFWHQKERIKMAGYVKESEFPKFNGFPPVDQVVNWIGRWVGFCPDW